jgi:hypothetical protein
MSRIWLSLFVLCGLVFTLAACAPTPAQAVEDPPEAATPEEVVAAFYDWYLGYSGPADEPPQRSPLADKAYHDSVYLAPAFVEQVDATIASFDQGGYDPILCAQDIPRDLAVESVAVEGDEATATMRSEMLGYGFSVKLEQIDGQWLIVDTECRVE